MGILGCILMVNPVWLSKAQDDRVLVRDLRVEPRFVRPGGEVDIHVQVENVSGVTIVGLQLVPAFAGGIEYQQGWFLDDALGIASLPELAPGDRADLTVRVRIVQEGAFKVGGLVRGEGVFVAPVGHVVRVARPQSIARQLIQLTGAFLVLIVPVYVSSRRAGATLKGAHRLWLVGGGGAIVLGCARWTWPESLDGTAAEHGLFLFFLGWTACFVGVRTRWPLWGRTLWSTLNYVLVGCGWVLLERIGIARLTLDSVWATASVGDALRWPLEVAQVIGLTAR